MNGIRGLEVERPKLNAHLVPVIEVLKVADVG